MKIMTEEYCRQCPWFIEGIGFLEASDPYWKQVPHAKCVCKKCPEKVNCETNGSKQDAIVCYFTSRGIQIKGVTM